MATTATPERNAATCHPVSVVALITLPPVLNSAAAASIWSRAQNCDEACGEEGAAITGGAGGAGERGPGGCGGAPPADQCAIGSSRRPNGAQALVARMCQRPSARQARMRPLST